MSGFLTLGQLLVLLLLAGCLAMLLAFLQASVCADAGGGPLLLPRLFWPLSLFVCCCHFVGV